MTGYYDLILGLITVSMLGLSGTLFVAGFALTTAVTIGGLFALVFVAHGLFVNEPVASPPEPAADRVADPPNPASAGFESAD